MEIQSTIKANQAKDVPVQTYLLEPFDMGMHSTDSGVSLLQSRFTNWVRTLNGPARFVCWLMPATLDDKISALSYTAKQVGQQDLCRAELLMEYRRHFESLQESANYQRSMCGMALWTKDNPHALTKAMRGTFDTYVSESLWPELFTGQYRIQSSPFGHLAPVGRPGGRMLWAILNSYEFMPAQWNFFKPTKPLLSLNFPLAISLDIPYTYERAEGIEAIENNIMAYKTHLVQLRGAEDSRAVQRIEDCYRTLREINSGDTLHKVHITIAVAAPDVKTLKERISIVINQTRAYYLLRQETAELLRKSIGFFTAAHTSKIRLPDTTWRVTSRELAVMLAPMGYRKLASTDGIMRGEAVEGGFPIFHQSWTQDKEAAHEIWVGMSGFGKTFMNNCYLLREYAENGIPFDLLEPMGHGRHLARAIGIEPYNLSARTTTLNPQDVVYPTLIEQKSHTIRLYETVLGRLLSGSQNENMERGLLGEALELLYRRFPDLNNIDPHQVPLCDDVCNVLAGLGANERKKTLARELADEIAGLCCGSGSWSSFLNGPTNVDLARRGRTWIGPRVFCFQEMSDDPKLLALAYTQVLSAIRRDSLMDEQPRIIVVDEVYRLMKFPALLDFLIEAYKTFRTRRKKLICIDQNMKYFLGEKERYMFENAPIRVIFNQGQGIDLFYKDGAFQHLNDQHKATIATLDRYDYVLDVQGRGVWYIHNNPSEAERARFRTT